MAGNANQELPAGYRSPASVPYGTNFQGCSMTGTQTDQKPLTVVDEALTHLAESIDYAMSMTKLLLDRLDPVLTPRTENPEVPGAAPKDRPMSGVVSKRVLSSTHEVECVARFLQDILSRLEV